MRWNEILFPLIRVHLAGNAHGCLSVASGSGHEIAPISNDACIPISITPQILEQFLYVQRFKTNHMEEDCLLRLHGKHQVKAQLWMHHAASLWLEQVVDCALFRCCHLR